MPDAARDVAPSWWTAADAAELDLIAFELVRAISAHRGSCDACAAGFPPCPMVGAAISAALEWRAARILRSRAAWLRARQTATEWAAAA